MRSQTITVAAAAIVAVGLLLAGCAGSTAPAPAPTEPAFGHVHGIIDLGDGTVLLGTHTGLYTLTAAGVLAGPVGGNDFDAMG
ncbi:MAG TPA: hypothetical protein DEB55_00515, partial [Microbacterium sp.]|nr:hypothetical protein [Microbacterium sp.]